MSSIRSPASYDSGTLRQRKPQAIPKEALIPSSDNASCITRLERDALVLSTIIKVLLIQSYHSTDFEVHRNWLAITHSLPISKWYFNATSEWTLDYPPFFAYFEFILSQFAFLVDPKIVQLENLNYSASSAVIFQRITVILSELVLVSALLKWARQTSIDKQTASIIVLSIIFHPGLLIVDHIHFQYNGMLLGILLWSFLAAERSNMYVCATLFATLLMFKHIFIYIAPPFFVFLLRRHCFNSQNKFQLDRLIELGSIVVAVVSVAFAPFLLAGGVNQIPQIVSRLFPFKRGLNHAYWAANFWAVCSGIDRVLLGYLARKGVSIDSEALVSSSRGLIGNTTFGVLPNVTPLATFIITLAITSGYMIKLWFNPTFHRLLESVTLSAMISFLFGWHVHEKAVLIFLIPMSLMATYSDAHLRAYLIASLSGVYALFPLLIKPAETPIKIIVTFVWFLLVYKSLRRVVFQPPPTLAWYLINQIEFVYLVGFGFLQLYVSVIHGFIFESSPHWYWTEYNTTGINTNAPVKSMEFLPLMLTSLYCSIGIIWSWLGLSWVYFTS